MEESGPAKRVHVVGGGAGNNAGRPTAEEEDAHTHTRTDQVHPCALCGTRASGQSSAWRHGKTVMDALPKQQKEEKRGMMSMAPAEQKALCRKDW